MLIYYLTLALILALGFPLCLRKPTEQKKLAYIVVTFGFLLFLVSARYGIGNDYFSYIDIYESIAALPFSEIFASGYKEPGYSLLCRTLSALGLSAGAMYFVMGVLCLAPVAWFIYKYSPNIPLSVWLYVTLTFFYGTMNFIRQNLAVAVVLLGWPLLRSRKKWALPCYAVVVLLACTFHASAAVLFPILLVCRLPLRRPLGITYAALAAALYLTSDYILDFVTDYIYTGYKGSIYLTMGFELYFLIVPALVLLLMLCLQKPLEQRFSDGGLLVNLMLYNFLIWLFITRHFILERFSLYVYIFVLLAVPMAVECLRPDEALLEEYRELREQLKLQVSPGTKTPGLKKKTARLLALRESAHTSIAFYWCLVAGVLVVSLCYNIFGMYDGQAGFHGVFPYRSVFQWINKIP